jgi:glycosyltransferase involved in cell wall biosynthesis
MNIVYFGEVKFYSYTSAAEIRILGLLESISKSSSNSILCLIGIGAINKELGFSYISIREGKSSFSIFFCFLFRFFFMLKAIFRLESKPDIIITYGSTTRIFPLLWIYCKFKGIKLVVDVVEWYDYSHVPLGRFGPFALDTYLSMHFWNRMADGLIVISNFLMEYYLSSKRPVVLVPILKLNFFQEFVNLDVIDSKSINICYVGYPGKKDLILEFIWALQRFDGCIINFHLIGVSKAELSHLIKNQLPANIIVHGKVKRDAALLILSQCHYSIILRPNKRFAQAGFPTKFVESLSCGTPVISNLTSDISKYLFDLENGVILNSISEVDIISSLIRICNLKHEQYVQMRRNAFESSNLFSIDKYSNELNFFISRIS